MPARKPDPEAKPQRSRKKLQPDLEETTLEEQASEPSSPVLPDLDESDLFAAHAGAIDRTLVELATGIKVVLPYRKRKLSRGDTSEWEVEDEQGGTVWVYTTEPSLSAARLIREQNKGKAAAKEARATATTLLLKLCVPGHDAEVNAYLASLPPETLARYAFDEATLAAIEAARE